MSGLRIAAGCVRMPIALLPNAMVSAILEASIPLSIWMDNREGRRFTAHGTASRFGSDLRSDAMVMHDITDELLIVRWGSPEVGLAEQLRKPVLAPYGEELVFRLDPESATEWDMRIHIDDFLQKRADAVLRQ